MAKLCIVLLHLTNALNVCVQNASKAYIGIIVVVVVMFATYTVIIGRETSLISFIFTQLAALRHLTSCAPTIPVCPIQI